MEERVGALLARDVSEGALDTLWAHDARQIIILPPYQHPNNQQIKAIDSNRK